MSFQRAILDWYAEHKRDLPWRKTDDPYKILVSEVMLQQTQVDRVIPKYLAFLDKFPDAQTLAEAQTADVITLWSGLGYNRRAVFLQKTAKAVTECGCFPFTTKGLEALPGIGPYTARALLAFAFHEDVAVVDTNIRRIFSRYFFEGKGTVQEIDRKTQYTVPKNEGTAWNNALMDFGSMLCTASSPKCEQCPLQPSCTAFAKGTQESYLKIAPPQKKFKGSRRQYRGMVLKLLKDKKESTLSAVEKHLGKDTEFVNSILAELERDELIQIKKNKVCLP